MGHATSPTRRRRSDWSRRMATLTGTAVAVALIIATSAAVLAAHEALASDAASSGAAMPTSPPSLGPATSTPAPSASATSTPAPSAPTGVRLEVTRDDAAAFAAPAIEFDVVSGPWSTFLADPSNWQPSDGGAVPRTRQGWVARGDISMSCVNAAYADENPEKVITYADDAALQAKFDTTLRKKLWDAFEANSGGVIRFVDSITGGTPKPRLLHTDQSGIYSKAQVAAVRSQLFSEYGLSSKKSDKRWGVISRSATRANGGTGGGGGGASVVVRNFLKPSLAVHELGHSLGLGHSRLGMVNRQGEYTFFSPYGGYFTAMNEGSSQLNGQVASALEQHFLGWNDDTDYRYLRVGQREGLRNVGRGLGAGRAEPVSLVWNNPYGGQHWFQYGRFKVTDNRSPRFFWRFADESGVLHEQAGPLVNTCTPTQDPFVYGETEYAERAIGTTGLRMTTLARYPQSAAVDVRFDFKPELMDMPPPRLRAWTRTASEKTALWLEFAHRDDDLETWKSTPYIIPHLYLQLECEDEDAYVADSPFPASAVTFFTHNATSYTSAQRAAFHADFGAGIVMWPKGCGRKGCANAPNYSMNRRLRIDVEPPLSGPRRCRLWLDRDKRIFKDLTLRP